MIGASIFKGGKVELPLEIGPDSYNLRELMGRRKVKALRRRSSVNLLIRKDYIEEFQLRFDEQASFYTDLSFSIPAISEYRNYSDDYRTSYLFKRGVL